MIWVCVAVRIIANSFSNVFQKLLTQKAAHPLVIICVTHGLLTLACAPLFLFAPLSASLEFWANISICAVLAVAANVLIVAGSYFVVGNGLDQPVRNVREQF